MFFKELNQVIISSGENYGDSCWSPWGIWALQKPVLRRPSWRSQLFSLRISTREKTAKQILKISFICAKLKKKKKKYLNSLCTLQFWTYPAQLPSTCIQLLIFLHDKDFLLAHSRWNILLSFLSFSLSHIWLIFLSVTQITFSLFLWHWTWFSHIFYRESKSRMGAWA